MRLQKKRAAAGPLPVGDRAAYRPGLRKCLQRPGDKEGRYDGN